MGREMMRLPTFWGTAGQGSRYATANDAVSMRIHINAASKGDDGDGDGDMRDNIYPVKNK